LISQLILHREFLLQMEELDRKESPKRRSRRLENDPLQLLSPEQTAGLLCVSRSTVDRLVQSGRLPYVRLTAGKRKICYAIRRKTLEKWIAENEISAASES
jgi:excisionase family DNA binding protein